MIEEIKSLFEEAAETHRRSYRVLELPILRAGEMMIDTLRSGGKILSCGNGGSACDAAHFASELLNRFERKRAPLPAIALTADVATLTAISNDESYTVIFGKQLQALGDEKDLLLAISTSGKSKNILYAIEVAHQRSMRVIALTGCEGGAVRNLLKPTDVEICVPSNRVARIQEIHLFTIHILCDIIDKEFSGAIL